LLDVNTIVFIVGRKGRQEGRLTIVINRLPEPPLDKTIALIEKLEFYGIEVEKKQLREAWWEEMTHSSQVTTITHRYLQWLKTLGQSTRCARCGEQLKVGEKVLLKRYRTKYGWCKTKRYHLKCWRNMHIG